MKYFIVLFVASLSTSCWSNGIPDTPFIQEIPTYYRIGDGIQEGESAGESIGRIAAIAVKEDGGQVGAALSNLGNIQLLEFEEGAWKIRTPFMDYVSRSPAFDRVACLTGKVFFPGLSEGAERSKEERRIGAYAQFPERGQLNATGEGVWQRGFTSPDEMKIVFEPKTPVLSLAAGQEGAAAVGTTVGLFIRSNAESDFEQVYPGDEKYSWAPRQVSALAYDSKGRLWFGSDQGVGVYDGQSWSLYTGEEGLPYDHFTCAAAGEDGVIWFGTEKGTIRFDGEKWAYRAAGRWATADRIESIAVEPDGTAWIACANGITRIERRPMSLEEKAKHYIEVTELRHNRDGYIADRSLTKPGDVTTAREKITDNDGQYTAWYGAAHCYKYALSGDPEAKAIAKRCFEACKRLVDVVPESMKGFPARVLIPADWPEPVNEQYGMEYNLAKQKGDPFWKLITPRFPLSEDGKYRWKNDTSSDEVAGHFLIYDLYYRLVADTEEEKEPVRVVVRQIMDYLIRNDFNLVDHDGKPTRWGRFGPDYLYTAQGWEQRGLNSLMLLSYLAVAEAITGDTKYAEVAAALRDKYFYDINAVQPRPYFPPENVVPWDNGFVMLSFYSLMNFDLDPERQILYRRGLEEAYLFISKQTNPFWSFYYGATAAGFDKRAKDGLFKDVFPDFGPYGQYWVDRLTKWDQDVEGSVESLREMPLDLVAWSQKNSHRLDVQHDPTPGQKYEYGWSKVDGKALPYSERCHVRLDRDCFDIDLEEGGEGSGMSLHEGTLFLLPYYLGRYYGFMQ